MEYFPVTLDNFMPHRGMDAASTALALLVFTVVETDLSLCFALFINYSAGHKYDVNVSDTDSCNHNK